MDNKKLNGTFLICKCGKDAFYNSEVGAFVCECGLIWKGRIITGQS